MTILIIPSWYPNEKDEINGSFFKEQAIAIRQCGHKVIILDATFQNRENYFGKRNLKYIKKEEDGLLVYSFLIPSLGLPRTKSGGYKIFLYICNKVFKRILNDNVKVDLIHAHSFLPAGIAACILGKRYSIPVVVTEHSSGILLENLSKERIALLKKTVEDSDHFICVSEALKSAVQKMTKSKKNIDVIPNIYSSSFYYSGELEMSRKEFIYLAVGRLEYNKRFDLLIKAVAELKEKLPNIRLKIVGDGSERTKLEDLTIDLGIQSRIQFCGSLSRKQTANEMRYCDAFVLASQFETFGIVYIEALACGKPIIATRNGGSNSIVNENNGLFIDVDDYNALLHAMDYMCRNIKKYNPKKISRECMLNYGSEKIVKDLYNIYSKMISEQK